MATGDELSKRSKFVLISWCGNEVGGLKRARLGTDKSELKQLIKVGLAVDDTEFSREVVK